MPRKRRIYQVAKEFNISIDALINFLAKANFDVHSHMSPVTDEMYEEVSKKFSKDIKIVGVDSDIRQKLREKKSVEDENKHKELHEYEEMLKASSMVMTEMPRRKKRTTEKKIYSAKTPVEIEEAENAESDSLDKEEQERVIGILETETSEEVIPSPEIKQPVENIKKMEPHVTQKGLNHDSENRNDKDKIKTYDENILYSIIETVDHEGLEKFFPNIVEHELENNKRRLKSSANLQDILKLIKNLFKDREFDKVEKISPALYQYAIQSSNLDEKKYSIQAAIYYGVSRSNQMIKNDNRLCAAEYLMNTNELYLRYLQHGYDLIQPLNLIENFFYNILNSGRRKYGENKLKDYRGCIIDALNSNDEVLKQNLVFGMIRLDKVCGFLSEELDNPKPEARKFKIELKRALAYQLGGKLRFSDRTSTNEILICIKGDYSQKITRFISCIESIMGSNYSEMKSKWKTLTETFKHISIYFVPEEGKLDTLFISILKRSFNQLYIEDLFNVEMYEEICHSIEDEVDRLKSYPITFNHYLNEFYLSLQKAIEEEYQKFNQKYKPDPQIMEVTKHYPLIKGRVFDLDINIRNSTGNDAAKNMVLKILDYGDKLYIPYPEISIGYVPQSSEPVQVKFSVEVKESIDKADIFYKLVFNNSIGMEQKPKTGSITIIKQNTDVDWQKARIDNPYKLTYLTDPEKLKGRKKYMDDLESGLGSFESWFIIGQKRVGKTSIAKVFQATLMNQSKYPNILPVYINYGDVMGLDTGYLAQQICELISECYKKKYQQPFPLEVPIESEFHGKFTKITKFLRTFENELQLRIIIMIDEFDTIPKTLYAGEEGAEFFQNLRAITSRESCCLILIGGEQMRFVIENYADRLNMLKTLGGGVDYLDIVNQIEDIKEIICAPSKGILEFSQKAIDTIVDYSSGNPYFVNLICKQIYSDATREEDSYIDSHEVEVAIDKICREQKQNVFNHFWSDGIRDSDLEREKTKIENVKILVAISQSSDKPKDFVAPKSLKEIYECRDMDIHEIRQRIYDLTERKVLEQDGENELFRIKVKLLHKWLRVGGMNEIRSQYTDQLRQYTQNVQKPIYEVTPEEISGVTKKFKKYQAYPIGTDDVRSWLLQFGEAYNQRLAFTLLKNVTFYTENDIINKINILYDKAKKTATEKGIPLKMSEKMKKPDNLFITHIDKVGKSGSALLRKFSQETNAWQRNVGDINDDAFIKALKNFRNEKGIILCVDDILGSGESAIGAGKPGKGDMKRFLSRLDDVFSNWSEFFVLIYGIIVAFEKGVHRFEKEFGNRVNFVYADLLTEKDQAFSESEMIFETDEQRSDAKEMCISIGEQIYPKNPLGFEDSELLVGFYDNFPNNTLPIFWISDKERQGKKWIPLFPRK